MGIVLFCKNSKCINGFMSTQFKSLDIENSQFSDRSIIYQTHERKNSKFNPDKKNHLFFYDTNRICSLDRTPALKKETLKSIGSFMNNYSKLLPKT